MLVTLYTAEIDRYSLKRLYIEHHLLALLRFVHWKLDEYSLKLVYISLRYKTGIERLHCRYM